eukprot:scaffold386665_cov25-Prasinocladus_malaysianus.AAC.1
MSKLRSDGATRPCLQLFTGSLRGQSKAVCRQYQQVRSLHLTKRQLQPPAICQAAGQRASSQNLAVPYESGSHEQHVEDDEADFTQGGWLWTNDASAQTKARLNAQKLRPKK